MPVTARINETVLTQTHTCKDMKMYTTRRQIRIFHLICKENVKIKKTGTKTATLKLDSANIIIHVCTLFCGRALTCISWMNMSLFSVCANSAERIWDEMCQMTRSRIQFTALGLISLIGRVSDDLRLRQFTETRRKWWNKFKHSSVAANVPIQKRIHDDVKKMAAVKLCVR